MKRFYACVLTSLTLVCAAACRSTATTPEGPSLRILPYGDSITRGKDDDGYRSGLAKLLSNARVNFHFVGRLSHGPWYATEKAHEGHNGATIHHLLAGVDQTMTQLEPDVVLLMIGANDLETGVGVDEMIRRYQTLLDRIVTARPRAHVLVSEITRIRVPKFDALAREANPKIKALVERLAGRDAHVIFVPMHDVVEIQNLDAVDHPDFIGNQRVAERWMKYLRPIVAR